MKNALSLMAIFAASTTNAAANISCKLSYISKYADAADVAELLIRKSEFKTEAILVTQFGTSVFNCAESSLDTFECYGFTSKPGETPTQLNVLAGGMQAGTVAVLTKLNLFYLREWAEANYSPSDFETRRFTIDSYTIKSCD